MTKARDLANSAAAFSAVSATELGYVDGVTSAIQTQLDAKVAKTLTTTTGDMIYASGANTPARLGIGSSAQVLTVASGIPSWSTPASSSGPAFHAYRTGNQTLSTGVYTKIQFDAENFDTDNNFDSTTNYRFTASKAGYYQVNLVASYYLSSSNWALLRLYFNGSAVRARNSFSGVDQNLQMSTVIYMNGSSDYLEGYAYGETGGNITGAATNQPTWIDAVWIRS